jgi:hypothetical protein
LYDKCKEFEIFHTLTFGKDIPVSRFSLELPALSFEVIKTANKICSIDLPVRERHIIMIVAALHIACLPYWIPEAWSRQGKFARLDAAIESRYLQEAAYRLSP